MMQTLLIDLAWWCEKRNEIDSRFRSGCLERGDKGAEALFGCGIPVAALELEEDRGVGKRHLCLQQEDMEGLPGFVEFRDDLLMRKFGGLGFTWRLTEPG